MAALLTSVIDNPGKVSEYILTCRSMGIKILPPDINEGEAGFSVSGGSIRYALTAIKGVGRPVIDEVTRERTARGPFLSLQDFVTRMADSEVNKRTVENFIKSGTFDGLGGTRKQFMSVFVQMMDSQQHNKKNNLAGQMSLFDLVSEEEKSDFEIRLPDVGEYSKELLLGFEKEVLGIYISGHPLEEYEQTWRKHITRTTADFMMDEETGEMNVRDQERVTVGGMIAEKKIKYTKNDKIMAFLTLEDLVGSIEVLVFPKVYEQESAKLTEENKVFVKGRVSAEEDRDGKLICESIQAFDDIRKTLWIKFPTKPEYEAAEKQLLEILAESDGNDGVVIYVENPKAKKALPPNRSVRADQALIARLGELYGEGNIKLV